MNFVTSAEYERESAVGKYLGILGWLYRNEEDRFVKTIEEYNRGKRVYFARERERIGKSGRGNLQVREIPNSPYWSLVTLDNKTKRGIIADILGIVGYPHDVCSRVSATIEDSGIKRLRSMPLLQKLLED